MQKRICTEQISFQVVKISITLLCYLKSCFRLLISLVTMLKDERMSYQINLFMHFLGSVTPNLAQQEIGCKQGLQYTTRNVQLL